MQTASEGASRIATSSSSPLDATLDSVARGRRRDAGPDRDPRPRRGAAGARSTTRLRALELVARFDGPIVDVGSGGGAPGIPLALALPEREVVLLEAERRKCEFLEQWAPPNARVVWGRAEEQETRLGGRRRREGARAPADCRRVVPAARARGRRGRALGRPGRRTVSTVAAVAARIAGELEPSPDGLLVIRKIGPTPAGLPAPHRRREEAPARLAGTFRRPNCGEIPISCGFRCPTPLARLASCPARSTRSRTRRAASARRRRRSTSPPVSPRPASARSSSTSTRRRTRPRGSACARTARRPTTCSTARRSPSSRSRRGSRTSSSSRRSPSSPARRSSSRSATDGERYLADALQHADGFDFVLLDCPPSLGPLTVNALAAADRVIVPVQTEYYALEGLAQLVQSINLIKARLNPTLSIAGVLLTMADGRTRLSADVEAEVRKHFGDARLRRGRAALGARRRGAEPRAARDPLRPALPRRRGLLEGGDGACRASLGEASAAASRC